MGNNPQEDELIPASALLREKLKGNDNELKALRDSAFADDRALRLLLSAKRGLGDEYLKDDRVKSLLEKIGSEAVNKAINEGNEELITHANGLMQQDKDISQFHRIQRLQDIISVKGRIFQFSGDPDAGKTNFGLFCLELWQEETGGTIITNMDSVKVGKTAKTFEKLKKFANEFDRWVFLMEDASNHISGYSVESHIVEDKLRPFKNELAKLGGNLFLLGHTGKDIHPDLRRNSYRVVKPNKKTAKVFETDYKGRKDEQIASYSGVPKSKHSYDPTETTTFEFNDSEGSKDKVSKDERIRKAIYKEMGKRDEIKTVDIDYNNSDVANVMRTIAEREDFLKFDKTSPKSIKKKR